MIGQMKCRVTKNVSGWDSCKKIYILSAVVCAMRYRSGYSHRIRRLSWSSEKGNPPCNAEDNLRAGLLVIEARFRGY